MNVAVMLRWVWQILRGEGGLWLQLLQAKYLWGEPLLACSRLGGSQFWRSIQKIKEDICLGISFSIGNGDGTQFLLDPWVGTEPLRVSFPGLFSICTNPLLLVSAASRSRQWNIRFRRTFGQLEHDEWTNLRAALP
uniref:Reverse transcriptase zinc-binding domain-containing protein n=1 Tax=Aegilops tauschii subsp. strangulata TaxID=200361 RepID=A0A453GAE5_AEGTS